MAGGVTSLVWSLRAKHSTNIVHPNVEGNLSRVMCSNVEGYVFKCRGSYDVSYILQC